MKSRKLLALFLAIFMLTSLVVPVSAADITPDVNVTNGIVGYDADLVEKVDLTNVPNILDYETNTTATAYKITDTDGWAEFDRLVDAASGGSLKGKTVYLANDLDFQNATISPIGTHSASWTVTAFSGVFDGQGHTIKNVTIQAVSATEINEGFFGLFNKLYPVADSPCGIKNFVIDESVKYSVGNLGAKVALGALIGTIQGANNSGNYSNAFPVEIYNVCNKADITYSSQNVSGLILFAKNCALTMQNCENQGDITYTGSSTGGAAGGSYKGIGGLLANFVESGKAHVATLNMKNCRNAGNITIEPEASTACGNSIGGLVADIANPSANKTEYVWITNCINNGNISVSSNVSNWTSTGGIVGHAGDTNVQNLPLVEINSCINYGSVVDNGAKSELEDEIHVTRYSDYEEINCVRAAGKVDPTYNMIAKYYQMSTETYKNGDADSYSLRLVALHNGDLDILSSFSYDIIIQYTVDVEGTPTEKTVSATTGELYTVKTSIAVDTLLDANATQINASDLGADYVSAVSIKNIPVSIGEITVTITPKMTQGTGDDAVTTTAAPITFTVNPDVYNTAA